VITTQGQVLTGFAVGGQFGGKTGFTQALAQVLAGAGLVFDDQQFHAVSNVRDGVMAEMIRDYPGRCPS